MQISKIALYVHVVLVVIQFDRSLCFRQFGFDDMSPHSLLTCLPSLRAHHASTTIIRDAFPRLHLDVIVL